MSFEPRLYDEIVRDLLTTLTGGTVRETLVASPNNTPLKLNRRPVDRVSHLQGKIQVGVGATARELPFKFTAADFELISTSGDATNKDALRFRDTGQKPIPGSTLTVNYYPLQTDPVPLTDLNIGSVIRTLLETVARELAVSYQQLDFVYKSAFLETAAGASLDKVVALVGIKRLPAGFPLVRVRFTGASGTSQVTVPGGTALTDGKGNRYLTLSEIKLEPGETTGEVLAGGEGAGTKPVEVGQLNRMEVLIAGIAAVTNPQPSRTLAAPETDADLRRRTAGALNGVVRGTVDSLKFSLLSIEGVKNVTINDDRPNGLAGEIKLDIAYNGEPAPDVRALVASTIDKFRPAGIRVIQGDAARKRLNVKIALTLVGSGLAATDLSGLQSGLEERLAAYLEKVAPGGKVRRAQLAKLALDDSRIADAKITLIIDEGEVEDLTLDGGLVLEVKRPFNFLPPQYEEQAGPAPASIGTVSAVLPVHLQAGITQAQASDAINAALNAYLASRQPAAPLDVDGLAAAIRDDSRFALQRQNLIVTVESNGKFMQLTDGVGLYTPPPNQKLQKGTINVDPQEGGL